MSEQDQQGRDALTKLLEEALGGAQSGATVVTLKASTKEDLFSKLREAIEGSEQDAIDESIRQAAAEITPVSAARMSAVALLHAQLESNKGHDDCAKFALEASFSWSRIAETLQSAIEHSWVVEARETDQAIFQASMAGSKTEDKPSSGTDG